MKLLSIDLPWSSDSGYYGFAWVDLAESTSDVFTSVRQGSASDAAKIFSSVRDTYGVWDLVLIDQPIGGAGTRARGCRLVERAFGNSSFIANGSVRIQGPCFQPGAKHVENGLVKAEAALKSFGNGKSTVVVESFPQLSVLPLMNFALHPSTPGNGGMLRIDAVTRLKAHKRSVAAAQQLVAAFSAWVQRGVTGPAAEKGQPDAVDALLALLPALEVLAPSGRGTSLPCWLHCLSPNGAELPGTLCRAKKAAARAQWMSPLVPGQLGDTGVRTDGILSLRQPGWPEPKAPERML